ncbi:carbohydrate kinase family protein [Kerstersia gyiorum]|jgi:adenosine kinase|uniref:Adenosine kinase n=1 Tax=Kerstersia gyiorum TaxID=206506 RepID=A0A171KQF1_9BURK|nr:carbohydrate kinase family protein [Kerstersia gyiorum]AZV92432.1 carbohydrate kinase family protein [Bordetella sp. J329]MCO7641873.1 carbohydrate kinase family protein [Pseudomonas sp. S 311-6]KAB0543918.1 carbohydrate kinase family protein [Kerstersia gyiorum]KKO71118.1 sugar kinase [Kerstersia gyiorum]MCH4270210.1 carbohydrate kinase family protein [Kerstersia gyiorum]
MAFPILVCGSIAFDSIAVFEGRFKDHILPDRIRSLSVSFTVPSLRKVYGGCAGNIAYNLRLLGGQPLPVATVGEDAGDYLHYLRQLGISTEWIRVAPGSYTAQCFVTTDLDDNQIAAFHPGAMALAAENDISSAEGAWAIVAPDAKEGMFAHARRLHARGIPAVFDLGQAMPLFSGEEIEEMLKLVQVLTLNDYEAGVVEQRTGRSLDDIARNLQAVVVTRGANGATVWSDGKTEEIGAVKADAVVDPTGCGDAHRAGLLYGVSLGWSWADSCRLGNVMGSIKVASRGPQQHQPSRADISARLEQGYGLVLPSL